MHQVLVRYRLARLDRASGRPIRATNTPPPAIWCTWTSRSDTLRGAQITRKHTRPYRPQTTGKVERFNRTLLDEWAYDQPCRTEAERRAALPRWLHTYSHHCGHTALGGKPPAGRVPNLAGQYTWPARVG